MTTTARPPLSGLDVPGAIPVDFVQLGRYRYTLLHRDDEYYVRCVDTESRAGMIHGPFDRLVAHAFIDARVERHESLKRDIET